MLAAHTIHRLPTPSAVALPLAADAVLQVKPNDRINSGERLAAGVSGADIVAPLAGRVAALAKKPLAAGGSALCVVLDSLAAQAPPPLSEASVPLLLKRAGIVGLGGGAFPAWRKWRLNLRWFIANGLETEPAAHSDAALIAAAGDALPAAVSTVAKAFAATPLLALPPSAPVAAHPIIRRLPPHYALGSERLLAERLCRLSIPPAGVPADYGVVCFNIATVLAMAAAISHGLPLCERVITVYDENGGMVLLRLPLGASVGAVRRFIGAGAVATAGGCDEQRQVGDDAVITAATTVLSFKAPARRAVLPCIRCGDCEPACPVALSPQRLYQLAQDNHWAQMAAHNVAHCLECRRCDEVCPSNIPLTAAFIGGKKQLAAMAAQQAQLSQRRQRFDQHSERLAKPAAHLDNAALRQHVAAAVDRVRDDKAS